jgi:hypothetical protein
VRPVFFISLSGSEDVIVPIHALGSAFEKGALVDILDDLDDAVIHGPDRTTDPALENIFVKALGMQVHRFEGLMFADRTLHGVLLSSGSWACDHSLPFYRV